MRNEKQLKNLTWKALCILVSIGIASFGLYRLYTAYQAEHADQNRYDALTHQVYEEEPIQTVPEQIKEEKNPIDFETLQAINPEVVGWITISDTKINYPIVYTSDNETYLHRDFEGNESAAGTIFLDCDSQGDFSGYHNVLYGHHMKDGTMFKDIVRFKEQDFFDSHREFVIYTPGRSIHLRTIAAVCVDGDDAQRRKTAFQSAADLTSYIDRMTEDCAFRNLPKGEIKTLYSLVTCSYEFENARTILYAAETDAWKSNGTAD